MAIFKSKKGKFEGVTIMEFGTGDIMFSHGDNNGVTSLIFGNGENGKIGRTTDEFKGLTSDDLPDLQVEMVFLKPESVNALIHSLIELQKRLFDKQNETN